MMKEWLSNDLKWPYFDHGMIFIAKVFLETVRFEFVSVNLAGGVINIPSINQIVIFG